MVCDNRRQVYMLKNGVPYDMLDEDAPNVFRSRKNSDWTLDLKNLQHLEKNGFSLVAGDGFVVPNVDVPSSRYNNLLDITPEMFKLEVDGIDTYKISNVPLYKAHGDTRKNGHVSSHAFIDRMIHNFYLTKHATASLFGDSSMSWLPKWHYGHTPNSPDIPEKSNVGFIDNIYRVGDFLFGDITGLDKHAVDDLMSGRYPDRSAEIDIKRARLLSVAALGYRTPHFALPQMRPQLRKKYASLVEKHSFGDVKSQVFLREDFEMPKADKNRKVNLDPTAVSKFFLELETNDELREKFEAAKDVAVQKHMDMNGGMAPSGGGLQQMIMQLIQQMMGNQMGQQMGQKMNTDSNNPYQMNQSDLLDLESAAHHASDDEFEEEGTEVAGAEADNGMRKGKQSGDSGVYDDGSPSDGESPMEGDSSDGNRKTINSDGKVVSKSIMQAHTVIKNAMTKLPKDQKEQVETAMNEFINTVKEMSNLVQIQGKALLNLQKDNSNQRHARRKESFSNRLRGMCEAGNPAVGNDVMLKNHLELLLEMNDTSAEKYLANLEKTPVTTVQKHVRRGEVIEASDNSFKSRVNREYNSLPDQLRKVVSEDSLAIAEIWSDFDSVEGGA